ncbi:hypothetical protein [Verrucomicrobium sp. BvORR034]|uniref:hypothetical protein n=1 Tax=Verrucomicrobium sp. BvORR034 TaxID=1396418 RepID=UPI0022410213|nr:hypothetical protein [Verrucomicrobium sp. BvORR034]
MNFGLVGWGGDVFGRVNPTLLKAAGADSPKGIRDGHTDQHILISNPDFET